MKTNKLLLLALGLVAVGCNDSQIEEESFVDDLQGEAVEVVLNGTIDNGAPAQTKSVAGLDEHVVYIEFQQGDEIGVYLNNETVGLTHENVMFSVASTEKDANDQVHATFTTDEPMILLGKGNNVYAYYPYAATETEFEGTSRSTNRGAWDGYHHFKVPAEQVQAGLGDYANLSQYVNLYAAERKLDKKANKVVVADPGLQFRHAFAYVSMNVKNEYDHDINIESATISFFKDGEPVAVAGNFAVALDDEQMAEEGLPLIVPGDSLQYAVTVKAESAEGLLLEAGKSSYIPAAIAPVEFDECVIDVVLTNGFCYQRKLEADKSIPQNTSQAIGVPISDKSLGTKVTNSEFAEYLLTRDTTNIVLDLAADIELSIDPTDDDAWGGASTKTITINGYTTSNDAKKYAVTFNMTDQMWNDVDVVNPDAVVKFNDVVLKPGTFKNAGYQYSDLNFDCKVDMKTVVSWTAMLARRSISMDGVNVSEAGNVAANYALWCAPTVEKQEVNINNFAVLTPKNSKGSRGIKIDSDPTTGSYDFDPTAVPQDVVLNLKGVNLFYTTVKAPILVRTLETKVEINVDPNALLLVDPKVSVDKENHVWIDEDRQAKENTDLITIKNARWKFENMTWAAKNDANGAIVEAYADDQDGLEGAYAFAYGDGFIDKIVLADGEYTLPAFTAEADRDLELTGTKNATLKLGNKAVKLTNVDLDLHGITFVCGGTTGGINAPSTDYKDVTFDGSLATYGPTTFTDCAFELGSSELVWVWSSPTVSFDNCTFDTYGRAIYVQSEVNADVTVKNCTFDSQKPAYLTDKLAKQICAALISTTNTRATLLLHTTSR